MVDASIGGKTAIDLGIYKNQLGVFKSPLRIYADPGFLETLPDKDILNGFAEMLKHALISSIDMWADLKGIKTLDEMKDVQRIANSQAVKCRAVLDDPLDNGQRRNLNFGHTVGHALEGFYLDSLALSHGHCVALGIVVESQISFAKGFLTQNELLEISTTVCNWFDIPALDEESFESLILLMQNDKKNSANKILGCTLNGIGNCSWNTEYSTNEIKNGLKYLLTLN
jgi:3-dehydroquinate synthase